MHYGVTILPLNAIVSQRVCNSPSLHAIVSQCACNSLSLHVLYLGPKIVKNIFCYSWLDVQIHRGHPLTLISVTMLAQAAPYVAGGPVGPDVWFKAAEPLTHAVLIHADPAGQHAAAVGTLSPSDCCPAGPAGPYVAGGPVGPDDYLQALEPCEQLVLDHADPAGQHAVILDTAESPEHAMVENILDGRPMEGITCPELLEYSLRLLDATLVGGLIEKISDWEPEASPVQDATLDGQLREGTTYLEQSAAGVSLDSGLMEGMARLEPLEQSVLNTLLVARPSETSTERI